MLDSKYFAPRRIFAMIFFALFLLSLVCIVAPMVEVAGKGNIGVWFPSIYLLALCAVTYSLGGLKKILKKTYRPLIVFFYAGMALFLIAFSIFCILIMGYKSSDIPENPDLVIVLGCQAKRGEPGNLLRYRLEKAAETLEKYPDAACIVAGGRGPDETMQESKVMKKYLIDKGIGENRIYEEDKSSSSFQNLSFSQKVIEENNLKCKDIIILTSEYHVPRAVLLAKRLYPGSNIFAVKANSPFALFGSGIVREFFAFAKSYIFDK
jgi:uncharacterized SAM-binding protein YcdF (DUF218 family)